MRIPFEEAIAERSLMKTRFDMLSFPQQVALKMLYGVPLSEHRKSPTTGYSEIDYWHIFQGGAITDDLGFVKDVRHSGVDPVFEEFREAWLIMGRRSGKTDTFAATIVAYEATLGGHEEYLRPRQQGVIFEIAQDLRLAKNALHFVRGVLESSALLEAEITNITADHIDLKNNLTIACVPPSLKSVRGYAAPVAVLDEVGVWYQEAESANPDYEIYRAITPGQIQFPNKKIVGISSPWNKAGLLFEYAEAGTRGTKHAVPSVRSRYEHSLVLQCPTAVMDNPHVTRDFLEKEKARDPAAFDREMLAIFQDSISGFIPSVLVGMAVSKDVFERECEAKYHYIAAMDPAFKRDAFGFTIMHNENGKIVQDVARRFVGIPDPKQIMNMIIPICKQYGISVIYSDQYQLQSLQSLARERGIEIIGITFTAKSKTEMYGNLQQLFLQRKITLLDDFDTVKELKTLERTITEGGQVSIAAPKGMHDDMATVVCIAASQCMWAMERNEVKPEEQKTEGQQYFEIIQEQIRRKWAGLETLGAWD